MKENLRKALFFALLSIALGFSACTNLSENVCSVNASKCNGCGNCLGACPHGAISLTGGKAVINSNKCVGCGKCIPYCSKGAIQYN